MFSQLRRFFILWIAIYILWAGCRHGEQKQTAAQAGPLIRLENHLYDPATEFRSTMKITAQNLDSFTGTGWTSSNNVFAAIEKHASFHFPDFGGSEKTALKLRFRARSLIDGHPLSVKIISQAKQLATVELTSGWKDYELNLPVENLPSTKTRQMQFVFGGQKPKDHGFAEFEFIEVPDYTWGSLSVGNDLRPSLIMKANTSITFHLELPAQTPQLYFGIALPPGSSTEQATFRISAQSGSNTKKVYEHTISSAENWLDQKIDLSAFAGQQTKLIFEALSPSNDASLAWSDPEIYDSSTKSARKNIILFSIDTMRQDRVSYYGYSYPTTPNVDKLAAKSIVFKNAYCTFPGTLPSHTSVMTGLYLSHHQVAHSTDVVTRSRRIAPSFEMIAEVASKAGYTTAAITDGGYVSSFYGFDQGFEQYVENDPVENADRVATVDKGIAWLQRNSERPFFLFLHTYRVHEPFTPPLDSFRELFPNYPLSGNRAPKIQMSWLTDVVDGTVLPTSDEKQLTNHCYDAEARFFDANFGRFQDQMQRLHLNDNTIVIVIGDHGEQLFDRGDGFGHGKSLLPEEVKVPLIVYIPGTAHQDRDDIVSLVDIYPTIAKIIGVPAKKLDGIDLLEPSNSALRKGRTVYYEVSFGREALWGTQNREFKLVKDDYRRAEFFYDLRKDPKEMNNLAARTISPMEIMNGMLAGYIRESSAYRGTQAAAQVEEDEELKEKLRALGYVN